MAEYCPHHATCPFYQNWVDYTRDKRTDVIVFQEHVENPHYDCLTLISLDDPERGIPIGNELNSELSDLDSIKRINCPLNSLNEPDYLETKVNLINFL